jgi:hypothetical protein
MDHQQTSLCCEQTLIDNMLYRKETHDPGTGKPDGKESIIGQVPILQASDLYEQSK